MTVIPFTINGEDKAAVSPAFRASIICSAATTAALTIR
jgi:hypothetical protein